jgi:hypothetical protein
MECEDALQISPYYTHQPSDGILSTPIASITEEQVLAARRAEPAVIDLIRLDADGNQLFEIGEIQIQLNLSFSAIGCHQVPCILELTREELYHIQPDLKAAAADRRPDRNEQVLRQRMKLLLHTFNCSCDDAPESAAPARMHSRKRAGSWVSYQNWNTIRSLDCKQCVLQIGNHRIAGWRLALKLELIEYQADIG